MGDLKWFIGILLLLTFLWVGLGGPERGVGEKSAFFTFDIGGSGTISDGTSQNGGKSDSSIRGTSDYSRTVTLDKGHATSDDYQDEYLTISASEENTSRINITGWRLTSPLTNTSVTIGKGAYVPRTGGASEVADIYLAPGETAILSTRSSLLGANFRVNKCIGYFGQFQRLSPTLPRECPLPEDENLSSFGISIRDLGSESYDACIDFIEDIPRCRIVSTARPSGITECRKIIGLDIEVDSCVDFDACRDFVQEYANYSGCVALHRNDSDFAGDEWRIFFGSIEPLWRDRSEVILLTDTKGEVVDVVSY